MAAHLRVVPEEEPREGLTPASRTEGIDDATLVDRAIDGDRWAEDRLVLRHAKEVARVVARLIGSHDEVDDVVQETFIAAFEQLHKLREPSVFRGWLLRIAINKSRRVIRKRKMLRTLGLDRTVPDATLEVLARDEVTPAIRAELAAVDEVLSRLPAEQRIAWMLRVVEGHTVRDVARLCGCSVATTKRRLVAAKRRVLAAVDEEVLRHGR